MVDHLWRLLSLKLELLLLAPLIICQLSLNLQWLNLLRLWQWLRFIYWEWLRRWLRLVLRKRIFNVNYDRLLILIILLFTRRLLLLIERWLSYDWIVANSSSFTWSISFSSTYRFFDGVYNLLSLAFSLIQVPVTIEKPSLIKLQLLWNLLFLHGLVPLGNRFKH